jgi:hypothetical protein
MTIDPMDGNFQVAGGIENGFVSIPIAPPLLVVANTFQKLLFGYSARHPALKNILASCKDGLDRKGKIWITDGQFPDKLRRVILAAGQSMVVADPNQIRIASFLYDDVSPGNGVKSLEFPVEIPDIFSAREGSKFPDVNLNPPDGCPFKSDNFSKTLLGIRHSALDLKTGGSRAKC